MPNPLRTAVFVSLALVNLGVAGPAQTRFLELGRTDHLPQQRHLMLDAAVGDLDGDGDQDAAMISSYGWIVLRGDGQGRFVQSQQRTTSYQSGSGAVALFDLDGDGDLEVLFAWTNGNTDLLRNDGNGGLTIEASPVRGWVRDLAVGDVDRDGDPDVFAGCSNPPGGGGSGLQSRLFRNDNGQLVEVTSTHLPLTAKNTAAVGLADVDGDGDLDAVLGNDTHYVGPLGDNELWRNDGTGRFSRDGSALPFDAIGDRALALGDVDQDGDPDLVTAGTSIAPWDDAAYLFRNVGGSFILDSGFTVPKGGSLAIALLDLDRDADLDLAFGLSTTFPARTSFETLRNTGGGTFAAWASRTVIEAPRGMAVLDADGVDGADLLAGAFMPATLTAGRTKLFLNDGTGGLLDATESLVFGTIKTNTVIDSFALADLGADGDLDMLECDNSASPALRLWLGDGDGPTLDVTATHVPPFAGTVSAFGFVDLDGDAYPDVWASVRQAPNFVVLLWRSDAAGRLAAVTGAGVPAIPGAYGMATADLDGAANPEMVIWSFLGFEIWRSVGGLNWQRDTRTAFPTGLGMPQLGDLDGDGFVDLIAKAGSFQPHDTVEIWRNQGDGTFVKIGEAKIPAVEIFRSMKLGDADADGDLDMFVFADAPALFVNNGSGAFTIAPTSAFPVPRIWGRRDRVADVDLDGDLDVVSLLTGSANGFQLFANDGQGRFTDASSAGFGSATHTGPFGFEVADFETDGDPDVLIDQSGVLALSNLHRHGHVPYLLRQGHSARLQWFGLSGSASAPESVLPQLAIGAGTLQFEPFGLLRLDLASLVFLPVLTIPAATASLSLDFGVPADPSIVGVRLHSQAIHLGTPGTPLTAWRYSNHAVSPPVR